MVGTQTSPDHNSIASFFLRHVFDRDSYASVARKVGFSCSALHVVKLPSSALMI